MVGALRVRADVVFPRRRVAVFVDGCFWHRCPAHGRVPSSNLAYWLPKLERNALRDRRVDEALVLAGWRVVRVWEHMDPGEAAAAIALALWPEGVRARATEKTRHPAKALLLVTFAD